MLLYLTQYLAQFESGFNVFNYLPMRAILGALHIEDILSG